MLIIMSELINYIAYFRVKSNLQLIKILKLILRDISMRNMSRN